MIRHLSSQFVSLIRSVAKKGFFHLLSANVMLRILGFGSQLFLIKLLAPEQLGQIKAMQSFIEMSLFVACFGLNASILKTCSEDRPLEQRASIFWQQLRYSLGSIVLVVLGLYCFAKLGMLSIDDQVNELMPYFIWVVPASALMALLSSYLQAIKQVKKMSAVRVVTRLFGVVLIVGFTWLYGIYGFIAATVAIGYLVFPLVIVYVKEFINLDRRIKFGSIVTFGEIKKLAIWSFLSNFTHRIAFNLDIFLLNYLIIDRTGFGYYSIATIFLIPIKEIIASVRSISLPYLSDKLHDQNEFYRVMRKYRKLMLVQSVIITIGACIVIPLIVDWFYGEQYRDVGLYFAVLAVGYIFHSYQALIPTALISMGKMNYTFYAALTYLPLSVGIHYFFIDYYGLIGGAIAKAIVAFAMMVIIIWYGNRGIMRYFSENEQSLKKINN